MFLLLFATLSLYVVLPAQSVTPDRALLNPAFAISATPTRPLLEQGGSTSVTLTVDSAYSGDFKLSFAGIPSPVVANTSTARRGAQTIVFRCPLDTPTGVYAIQITVAAGKNQQTLTFPFVVYPGGNLGPR